MRLFHSTPRYRVVTFIILSLASVSLAGKIDFSSYQRISFHLLSGFDYPYPGPEEIKSGKVKATIPAEVQALDQQKISIDGFMMPMDVNEKGDKVIEFFLVKDMASCCFGGVPALNGWIHVKMKPGTGADYDGLSPVTVYGVLAVGADVLNGQVPTLYRMEGEYAEISKDYKMEIDP